MQKDLDENSYEKRIENIEKGKSYLKSNGFFKSKSNLCLLYTSPSPRDKHRSRMPSSA